MPKVFVDYFWKNISLSELLDKLPQYPENHDFGLDINQANCLLLSNNYTIQQKVKCYFDWLAHCQPCLFGRMSAYDSEGLSVDVCWLDENDINLGDFYLTNKIQAARRSWKERAEKGESHGFLVIFNNRKLVFAKPSFELLEVCKHICNFYFVEHAPVETDVIYTEAIPLRDREGRLSVFKAGANVFYTGAHKTRNHDRRIPGGLMISVNSPGHYANSLVLRGIASSFSQAVEYVRNIAWRSIGNGGIGDDKVRSATWHNRDLSHSPEQCPMKHRPPYIPADFSTTHYSALYHTDILVPTSVTIDDTEISEVHGNSENLEAWNYLRIDYLQEKRYEPWSRNYALFHGHPIADEAKYHNLWPPIRVCNTPNLTYGYPRIAPEIVDC